MKIYRRLTLTVIYLIAATGFGCSAISQIKKQVDKSQSPQTIRCTDGKCELTVPGSWSAQTALNEQANLQAANPFAEQYLIVIAESKADFTGKMNLDDYKEIILENVRATVTDPVISDGRTVVVNGYPARQFEVAGSIKNIKANWIYTLVDAPKNYHQILAWSTASKFEANKPILLEAINSFKELDETAPPAPSAAR